MQVPDLDSLEAVTQGSGEREISTTMAFVRILSSLAKDKNIGQQVVPIVPDEARTFGMEGMFRQLGIYSSVGQKYTPVDAGQIMYYKETEQGQILEEGINEAGATSAWLACATSYSTHQYPQIPFYIFYSMFGFQRIGDLAWAAGDSQARGFLIGATAGRTTLNGEGLQHQDGHSHLLASTIPNCVTYDPTYAYELAVIVQDGLDRMYQRKENCFYYITAMNENYAQPAMPEGVKEGIIRGIYPLKQEKQASDLFVHLMGCGAILREVEAAAEILKNDFNVSSDIWSLTSVNELRKDGLEVSRWNRLHPDETPKQAYITEQLNKRFAKGFAAPVVVATDYMKLYADQLREFIPARYAVLGTDGFGRSDTREQLRRHFEVDRYHVVISALKSLSDEGKLDVKVVKDAMDAFNIDADRINPVRA